jgi:hypothetical protein
MDPAASPPPAGGERVISGQVEREEIDRERDRQPEVDGPHELDPVHVSSVRRLATLQPGRGL